MGKREIILFLLLLILIIIFLEFYTIEDYGPFYVIDGDTVKGINKYRELYIDTPELNKQKTHHLYLVKNVSCLRETARKAKEYVKDRLTKVTYNPFKKDKYGRFLALFYSKNGELWKELVSNGLAFCFYRTISLFELDNNKKLCLELEKDAKERKVGMWGCADINLTPVD